MSLHIKLLNPAEPVVFYEVIPPSTGPDAELTARLDLVREVASKVDAINVPEIREETRRGTRPLRQRMAPRLFAKAIGDVTGVPTVVNRVTVHESASEQRQWLRQGFNEYGIRNLILVGGEANGAAYPGPSVVETAALISEENLPFLLGGITIPHRSREADRIRAKHSHGIKFFTTQVLLHSKDIVPLIRELSGLSARILLSFTPVSNTRDLDFLEWLGVEIPVAFRENVQAARSPEEAVEHSIAQARGILAEACRSRGPQGPALGLQVERITKRNSAAARRMLAELQSFYCGLLEGRIPAASGGRNGEAVSLRSSAFRPES